MALRNKQRGFIQFLPMAAMAAAQVAGGIAANRSNARSAAQQMEFQRNMSDTAHRREMHDLREAGLNPILSARYGGASTPPGSSYTAQDVAGPAMSTAMQGYGKRLETLRLEQDIAESKSRMDLNSALTATEDRKQANLDAQTNLSRWHAVKEEKHSPWWEAMAEGTFRKLNQEALTEWWRTSSEESRAIQENIGIGTARSEEKEARARAEIMIERAKGMYLEGKMDETTFGEAMRWIKRFFDSIGGASQWIPDRPWRRR